MDDDTAKYVLKAIIIQTILLIVSGIVTIYLMGFYESKGSYNLVRLSTCLPYTVFGLYILFGKYVHIRGFPIPIKKPFRICVGLFFILLMPVIWLI
jgi:hypothetical protein